MDVWIPVFGFVGRYEISTNGKIKRLKRVVPHARSKFISIPEIILSPKLHKSGYLYVNLTKDGVSFTKQVHRVLMESIRNESIDGFEVNHIDCNKENNSVDNLEIVNRRENLSHRYKNATSSVFTGVHFHKRSGLFVARIFLNGKKLHIGCSKSELEAGCLYDAAISFFGLSNLYKNNISKDFLPSEKWRKAMARFKLDPLCIEYFLNNRRLKKNKK